MSVEEDAELKNLVAQTLENKGVLPKIRAELRANVFLALEENPNTKETLLKNDGLSDFLKFPIGALVLNLIREFLEFFELEFTLSVFEPETKYGKEYNAITRDKMIKDLKIKDCNKNHPILVEVIEKVISYIKNSSSNNSNNSSLLKDKKSEEIRKSEMCASGDNANIINSPSLLNVTYVKRNNEDFSLQSPVEREGKDDANDSIKEEVISINYSESDSLSEGPERMNESPKLGSLEPSLPISKSKDSKLNIINTPPKETLEIDLLTFTPAKETKSKEKPKNTVPTNSEIKTDEKKDKQKTFSVLGDLPPLNTNSEEKGFSMNDIKAIIDDWSGKVSPKSNKESLADTNSPADQENKIPQIKSTLSNESPKSDNTDADDFEDDIIDLLNGHAPMDTPLTIEETISKASSAADYLESL